MLASAAVVSVLSFGLSKINLIDYKSFNDNLRKKSIDYNYKLELPESGFYERHYQRSLIEKIYIVEAKKEEADSMPIVIIDNKF